MEEQDKQPKLLVTLSGRLIKIQIQTIKVFLKNTWKFLENMDLEMRPLLQGTYGL